MKRLAILLSLLISASALADADLTFTSLTTDKAEVRTGERFRLTGRVTNAGPDVAFEPRVTFQGPAPGYFLEIAAPAGWSCSSAVFTTMIQCTAPSLAAGAVVEFGLTAVAPPVAAARHTLSAHASSSTRDPNQSNSARATSVSVIAAPTSAVLIIDAPRELQVANGTDVVHQVTVHSGGPDEARNIAVVFDLHTQPPLTNVSASGTGWTCGMPSAEKVVCRRDRMAAHTSSQLELRFTAPEADTFFTIQQQVFAELNQNGRHELHYTSFFVGARENWRMMMIPVTATGIRGANNSLWNTDLRMFIASDVAVETRPHNCDGSPIPECFPTDLPLRQEFDPRGAGRIWDGTGVGLGQFFYVRAADFEKVRMNARIYDVSRETETAGAEMPIPRDDDFTNGIIDLLSIPVAPQYRHTLRVYDAEGRDRARVRIRIFAGAEAEPRVVTERTLTLAHSGRVTTALLPTHAAVLQAELGQLLPLAGLESLRVEIEPVDPTLRLWAFVSITNNDTHHVTTVTPQ